MVSGAHLEKDFGKTIEEIEKDGFTIHHVVEIDLDESKPNGTSHAIGTGVLSISKALIDIKPDVFLVYADRFEGFAAVIAATQMNIPTAHIEGGDITEGGALDDSVRHAMSKVRHLVEALPGRSRSSNSMQTALCLTLNMGISKYV